MPRIFELEAPSLSSFEGGRTPFLVVEDEEGCPFAIIDLALRAGKVVICGFGYIGPGEHSDFRYHTPLRFPSYRVRGGSVHFRDRHNRVVARIDLVNPQA
jgi:hypothetical protein